jgi:hypothetical protein
MRFQIDASDFIPLQDFSFRYRWPEPRYNVLPPSALAAIHPLTAAKAREIHRLALPYRRSLADTPVGVIPEHFGGVATAFSTFRDESSVPARLQALVPNDEQSVVASWDDRTAVLTAWWVFRTYWDDFCYPSSDDVTVIPHSGDWLLWYDHEERFLFGHLRYEVP